MQFEKIQYLDYEGNLSKDFKREISKEDLIKMYKTMHLTRRIDERCITLQRQGVINFVIGSRGEEGCAVASAAALTNDDWLFFQYREQAAILWRGLSTQEYMDHMLLNENDPSLGRQMSNHYGKRELNSVTVSSTLATQIPNAAGAAYAMKVRNEPNVSLCYLAEGSASEGDFHAGVHMGAVRRVPCIFFCRNNKYAISTSTENQYRGDGIVPRSIGYGIQGFRVDGNDVFAVYDVVAKAKEICLSGEGPVLIEAMTYRVGAHSTADDPTRYRKEGEAEEWDPKDPIQRLRLYLDKKRWWNDKKDKEFLEAMYEEVEDAIKVARNTPKPGIDKMFQDVYHDVPWNLQEQYEFLQKFNEEEGH
tara:strand:+ start:103 stop:1188 length:1086 start_codon:yes stop_codon:yes gene_type:complete